MLDLTLLLGFIIFVVVVNRWLKTSAEEQERINEQRDRRNLMILIPAFAFSFFSCNNDNNSSRIDSSRADTSRANYEVYFTQQDLDSLKNEVPDSLGKVFSRREYDGMHLFMLHCNKCHPGGEKGFGPSLIDKDLPDFLIHFQVRNGLGDMPAFTKEELPKDDVKKIILFIHALHDDYKDYKSNPDY